MGLLFFFKLKKTIEIHLVRPTEVCGIKYKVRKIAKSLLKPCCYCPVLLRDFDPYDHYASCCVPLTKMPLERGEKLGTSPNSQKVLD